MFAACPMHTQGFPLFHYYKRPARYVIVSSWEILLLLTSFSSKHESEVSHGPHRWNYRNSVKYLKDNWTSGCESENRAKICQFCTHYTTLMPRWWFPLKVTYVLAIITFRYVLTKSVGFPETWNILLLWFSSPSFMGICCWSNMPNCSWCTDCWWTVLFSL